MTKLIKLKFGLVINPFAGIGGKVGLKGSDGKEIRQQAFAQGAVQQAENRAKIALEALEEYKNQVEWFCPSGPMGGDLLDSLEFDYQKVYQAADQTTANDTVNTIIEMNKLQLDLLVFVGGDGTARDVCQSIREQQPVLGIPAGVKIHSGVYALTPSAAGLVLQQVVSNQLVSIVEASVMDIDEDLFRQGQVKAKKYGEMLVPAEHQYMQATKLSSSQVSSSSSLEDEKLAQQDIAEYLVEQMDDEFHYLIGSGTSCAAVMDALDLPNNLLGIDWIHQEQLIEEDLAESDILRLLKKHSGRVKAIITVIGGQGHILGRGNHQLSSKVMAHLSKDDLIIIATKNKIHQLANKPLIVDSDEVSINHKFSGLFPVITGYDDQILYRVGLDH